MGLQCNICLSLLKNSTHRCKKYVIAGTDFCSIHQNSTRYDEDAYNTKHENLSVGDSLNIYLDLIVDKFDSSLKELIHNLDKDYYYNLLGLYDSWNEIPIMYWHKLDNNLWDLRELLKIFAVNLNQTNMDKPFPMYPENPLTRNKISVNDLDEIRKKLLLLTELNMPIDVNVSLDTFLHFPRELLQKIRDTNVLYDSSQLIINNFMDTLRFKLINYKDSQGRYCGYWVSNDVPKSKFEKCYNRIIAASILMNDMDILIGTTEYRKLLKMINKIQPEEYVL